VTVETSTIEENTEEEEELQEIEEIIIEDLDNEEEKQEADKFVLDENMKEVLNKIKEEETVDQIKNLTEMEYKSTMNEEFTFNKKADLDPKLIKEFEKK